MSLALQSPALITPRTSAQAHINTSSHLGSKATETTSTLSTPLSKPSARPDRLSLSTQRQLFAGAAGATAVTLSVLAAQKMAVLGASLGGTRGAVIGAALGGLSTAAVMGAGMATISEPLLSPGGAVIGGGALAGAALGLKQGGLTGALLGAGVGAGLAVAAVKSGLGPNAF